MTNDDDNVVADDEIDVENIGSCRQCSERNKQRIGLKHYESRRKEGD